VHPLVKITNKDGKLSFDAGGQSREANAMSGTMRQLVANMVNGVSKGFEKKLTWSAWASVPRRRATS
jgi:large subunit ribosomal protein L6